MKSPAVAICQGMSISFPTVRKYFFVISADVEPNLNAVSPSAVWYVQVGALVLGHVLALVLAHDRAVSLFSSSRTAIASQYAMLALMVTYTVAGLWLLSSG